MLLEGVRDGQVIVWNRENSADPEKVEIGLFSPVLMFSFA